MTNDESATEYVPNLKDDFQAKTFLKAAHCCTSGVEKNNR